MAAALSSNVGVVLSIYFLAALIAATADPNPNSNNVYIVRMDLNQMPSAHQTHADWYSAHLDSVFSTTQEDVDSGYQMIYTYATAYTGFAASLRPDQAETLRTSPAVLSVSLNTMYSLHTTRTPLFLGLETEDLKWWPRHTTEELNLAAQNIIIGVLDTGVWPQAPSFLDHGMNPVPERWNGKCVSDTSFNSSSCNQKLIGARSYYRAYAVSTGDEGPFSVLDVEGHGSHTASTAAGNRVPNANLNGFARGEARGVAYTARLAVYKVCWEQGCMSADILMAMEDAINDGVDVLSLSLGGGSEAYYKDSVATGAFSAMTRGIFVSCSAGNSGPKRGTAMNVAPWIMTVGAGTLDRDFPAYALLGDRTKLTGVSLYGGAGMGSEELSLVYGNGGDSSGGITVSANHSKMCLDGSLDPAAVKGKVVLCDRGVTARVAKGQVVLKAGGRGMILANLAENGEEMVADVHVLPTVAVGYVDGNKIRSYAVEHGKMATATLSFGGTVVGVRPSPVVAAFSSRGPNVVTPEILKPDIIGPGVNILAAWTQAADPKGLETVAREAGFNIISGTSMSCPHISGLAALLKAAHPDWSASAIKSALMTTAYVGDNTRKPLRDAQRKRLLANPFSYGNGHADIQRALAPGVVYDIAPREYIAFLCSLGYTPQQIAQVANHTNADCSHKLSDPSQLNYPSFSVQFREGASQKPVNATKGRRRVVVQQTRRLTNVENLESEGKRRYYRVFVEAPSWVNITVRPSKLTFRQLHDVKSYTVTFSASKSSRGKVKSAFARIVWKSGKLQVSSPVALSWA